MKSEMTECQVTIEGEFVTQETMEFWGWSELLMLNLTLVWAGFPTLVVTGYGFHLSPYHIIITSPPSVSDLRQRIEAVKKHCRSQPKKLLRPQACIFSTFHWDFLRGASWQRMTHFSCGDKALAYQLFKYCSHQNPYI